ncbi:MAG TPA: tetratricopeptide repeat protein, partial [Armatimonadota bacterium]|nr:tetratricopeptide repeat protein [Armatimonadota bacterium]
MADEQEIAEQQEVDEGQLLREHLFAGDLLHLPPPEEGIPGFLPEWYAGELPALVYPPLGERGFEPGENINLQVSHYNIYYGALRELAETADADRGEVLRKLVLEWNPQAALEVCELARLQIERDVESAMLHYELAMELDDSLYEAAQDAGMCQYALSNMDQEGREEHLENAEELFRRAIELRPEAGLSWWSLARVLFDRGDPQGSEIVLRQFLADHPEGAERDLVENALQTGFQEGSISDEQSMFQQAQALAFGGNPQQAIELLQPLADSYPDVGEIWFVLGAAYRR